MYVRVCACVYVYVQIARHIGQITLIQSPNNGSNKQSGFYVLNINIG